MPTRFDPVTPDQEGIGIVAQVQRHDRRSAYWSAAHDADAVFTPAKVVLPFLGARVEQRNGGSRLRVHGLDLVTLVAVADRAAQPEVRLIVGTPVATRPDVFDLQAGHHQLLGLRQYPQRFPAAARTLRSTSTGMYGRLTASPPGGDAGRGRPL